MLAVASQSRLTARSLLEPLRREFDPEGRRLVIECDDAISFPEDQAAPVVAIAREGIANALQHAYPEQPNGKVWVRLQGRGRLRLSIFDMGRGLPELSGVATSGLDRIDRLARELGGFARVDNRNYGGAEVTVVFPEREPASLPNRPG